MSPPGLEPTRTCVACRVRRAKAELIRVVRRPGGDVVIDSTGHADGRGAYLCADDACWNDALKRSALQRALGTQLPTEIRNRLEQGATAAVRDAAARQAPLATQGGTHGA